MDSVLAIDSASEFLSVALSLNGKVYSRSGRASGGTHSAYVLPWVREVLEEAGTGLRELSGIAFGAGPGAFTGVRMACAVAQGLAFGAGKKAIGINNLEALALSLGRIGRIAVINDARMSQFYCAAYDVREASFTEISAPRVLSPAEVPDWVGACRAGLCVGNALEAYGLALETEKVPAELDAKELLAWISFTGARESDFMPPDKVGPLYVRNHVALTIRERENGERL